MTESLHRSIQPGTLEARAEKLVQQRFHGKRPAELDQQQFSEGEEMLAAVKAVFSRMEAESGGGAAHAEAGPRILSFREAVEELNSVFDLNAARDAAVEQQERWGLVQALIDASVVRDRNGFHTLFDQVTFTGPGLDAVRKKIERDEPQRVVFNPGGLTLPQGFETLFIKAGIPYWQDSYALSNLGAVRHVMPRQVEGLEELHTLSREAQLAAFAAAYQKASPLSVGQPTVLFTPDEIEVSATGKSATYHMQSGTQVVDPMTDFIRWRAQVDTALNENPESYADTLKQAFANRTIDSKLPDRINITQYPFFVLPNGGVLAFRWYPDYRKVCLDDDYPDITYGSLGPRLALR